MKRVQTIQQAEDYPEQETIDVLIRLLDDARSGEVRGLAFSALRKGREYGLRTTGLANDDPTWALGTLIVLGAELVDRIRKPRRKGKK